MSDSKKEVMESLLAAFPAWTVKPYVHWAIHVSLYSAKTRSYMIKKGIHFTETSPMAGVAGAKDRWAEVIMPTLGYSTLPVLDLPDGTFISDTTAIVRYLEEQHPEPSMLPANPIMRALGSYSITEQKGCSSMRSTIAGVLPKALSTQRPILGAP
jgi:hypothetical protein